VASGCAAKTRWAAHTLAGWDKRIGEKLPLYVGVNLSAIQVARDDIAGAAPHATVRRRGADQANLVGQIAGTGEGAEMCLVLAVEPGEVRIGRCSAIGVKGGRGLRTGHARPPIRTSV